MVNKSPSRQGQTTKGQWSQAQFGSNSSVGEKTTHSQQPNTLDSARRVATGPSPNLIKRKSRGSSRKPLEIIENKSILVSQKDQSPKSIMAAHSMKSISTQISQTSAPLEQNHDSSRLIGDSHGLFRSPIPTSDKSMMTELTSSQLDLILNDFSKFKSTFKVGRSKLGARERR